ncbi:methylenetetrahydrofolate reductase [Rubrobacter xylanophilus]|uniref:Methylenetetrahydrofolate reductase n=1 Tax=Rubrobacter xylanophilus TaxID=49319 RepID=A0A510HE32_9ACTN|nr:methylenetetrahydrofolate reductase [Rubrobacter xylanophilus]
MKEHAVEELPLPGCFRYEIIPLEGIEEGVWEWVYEGERSPTLTITASPARGMGPTVELVRRLREGGYAGRALVPHLSARLIRDERHLEEIVARLKEAEVEEVFVVGGDAKEPAGKFRDALGLLEALKELGSPFERVGIAGYPEGHPFIEEKALMEALIEKSAHASYVVSQVCFDAGRVVKWVGRIRGLGVRLPVVVGVAAPIEAMRLARIATRIGVGESARFLRKQRGWLLRLLLPGKKAGLSYDASGFLEALVREGGGEGVSGIHLYTFNDLKSSVGWVRRQGAARGGF